MAFVDLVIATDRAAQRHLGAVPVVYAPGVIDPVTVQGIFDRRYLLEVDGEAGVEQRTPAVFLRLEDLPLSPDDCDPILTIDGVDYAVSERQPDSMGGMRLLLHLAEA